MNISATVDYSVPLSVRIENGEVSEVWLHLDSFQSSPPGRYWAVGPDSDEREIYFRDVFFSDDAPEEIRSLEVCDGEHPLADQIFKIADNIRITGVKAATGPEFPLMWEQTPKPAPTPTATPIYFVDDLQACAREELPEREGVEVVDLRIDNQGFHRVMVAGESPGIVIDYILDHWGDDDPDWFREQVLMRVKKAEV